MAEKVKDAVRKAKGVLFDLDGTFADTAPDLAYALNETLAAWQRPALPYEEIRPAVSHGGRALIALGFGLGPDDREYETVREKFLEIYKANLARHTRLFPGMEELLKQLEQRDIPWGIVTNKPSWLTNPLMAKLGLTERAACIVSGDTTAFSKPHPEPLFHACRLANCRVEESLYVGDAERDIEAGRRAGTRTLVALFGYLASQDRPETWGADGCIQHPLEVMDWVQL